jgi:U3 small nucleolar RNA-associated protein 14
MKQKRAEFLKLKAMQTYQEAKFKRLKSIKSKRYRKILRLEREKNEEKKLSAMEKDDPLQFKEVLKEMEKKRMMVTFKSKIRNVNISLSTNDSKILILKGKDVSEA